MESEKMKKRKRPTKSSSSSSLDSISSSVNSSSQCTPNSPNNKKRKAKVQDPDNPPKRTSIYRGVTKHRWTGRYEAHLWDRGAFNYNQQPKKGKQIYLGAFEDEKGAAHIYDLAALKYWGPSTTLNFPVGIYEKEIKEMERLTKDEYVASLRRRSCGFSRGVSKYRGVARHHHNGRWEARIGRVPGNKYMYLGTYGTQEEAAVAYDRAAIHYRGAKAVTNFDVSRYIGFSKNDHPPCHNSPATNEEQNVEQKHDRGEAEKQEQKTITPPETIEFLKDEDCSKKNEEETIVLRETIEFLKDKDCSEKHEQESTVLPQTIEFLKDEDCSEKQKQETIIVPQTIEFLNDEDLLKDRVMNLMNEYEYQDEQSWTSLCLNADELCKLEVSDHVPREKPGDSLSSLFKDIDTGLEKYMDLKYNGPSSVENEFDNVDLFFNEPSYLKYEFNQYEYMEDGFVQILPMGDEVNKDLAKDNKECVCDKATNLVDKEEKTKKQNVIPLSDDKRCPSYEASDLLDKDKKMNQNVTYSSSPSSSTTSIYGMF